MKVRNEMNLMSEENVNANKTEQKEKKERFPAVDINEIEITGNHKKTIYFKNNISTYTILICGVLLLITRNVYAIVLGLFCVAISLFVLIKVKDHRVMDIYDDSVIIYATDDDTRATKVMLDDIVEWSSNNNPNGAYVTIIKLKNGQTIVKDTFQLGRVYNTLFDLIPDKETRQIQINKNKNQKLEFHNPLKKWFKKK